MQGKITSTIGQKFTLGALVALAIILISGVFAGLAVRRLSNSLHALNGSLRRAERVADIRAGLEQARAQAKTIQFAYVIERTLRSGGGHDAAKSFSECGTCHSIESAETYRKEFDALAGTVNGHLMELRRDNSGDGAGRYLEKIESGVARWQALFHQYLDKSSQKDFTAAHNLITEQLNPVIGEIESAVSDLEHDHQASLAALEQSSEGVVRSEYRTITVLALCGIACGGILVFLARRTNRALQAMAAHLRERAAKVAGITARVRHGAAALAGSACVQSDKCRETAGEILKMTGTARSSTSHASEMDQVIGGITAHIDETNRKLADSKLAMNGISEATGKISSIIKVIEQIAMQTNLLALNAAVEAARAGQAGMGFGVVSDEVRQLAQRCALAAQDTNTLIEESVASAENGRGRLAELAAVIERITGAAGRLQVLAGDVVQGSRQQSSAMEGVGRTTEQMQSLTAKTTAAAGESESMGQELGRESDGLEAMVDELASLVGGVAS